MYTLIYAPQCPNCTRFLGALKRTPIFPYVNIVDVNSLSRDQLAHVSAVPTLITENGSLVGTQAFQWLKQFEQDLEPECFNGGTGLAFSHVEDNMAPAQFSTSYSTFEPVD